MSGGSLTDYNHNLYLLNDWADKIEAENPLLAEQMRDMAYLLGRYDYYMSGDIGENGIQKAWGEYRDKWIEMDTDEVKKLMFEKCLDMVNSILKGYRKRGIDGN